jgi:hypothetical protein
VIFADDDGGHGMNSHHQPTLVKMAMTWSAITRPWRSWDEIYHPAA